MSSIMQNQVSLSWWCTSALSRTCAHVGWTKFTNDRVRVEHVTIVK